MSKSGAQETQGIVREAQGQIIKMTQEEEKTTQDSSLIQACTLAINLHGQNELADRERSGREESGRMSEKWSNFEGSMR